MEKVKNGKEKQISYDVEYRQFKKAIKEEFYLEAVAIGYAIVEDRLVAFLHYAGVVSRNNNDLKVNKSVYPYYRRLLNLDDSATIKIKDLGVKTKLITALINMTEEDSVRLDKRTHDEMSGKKKHIVKIGYANDIYLQLCKLNKDKVLSIIQEIDLWKNDRNQLIHALLSKTSSSAEIAKKECAEKGYLITRDIDNYLVKPFKIKNSIRKKYNIQ